MTAVPSPPPPLSSGQFRVQLGFRTETDDSSEKATIKPDDDKCYQSSFTLATAVRCMSALSVLLHHRKGLVGGGRKSVHIFFVLVSSEKWNQTVLGVAQSDRWSNAKQKKHTHTFTCKGEVPLVMATRKKGSAFPPGRKAKCCQRVGEGGTRYPTSFSPTLNERI